MDEESDLIRVNAVSMSKIEAANLVIKSDIGNAIERKMHTDEKNLILSWSFLTLTSNFWVLFSVTLWPSILSYPTGILFVIDCLAEVWLLIDIICRLGLKRFLPVVYKHIDLLHADHSDSYRLLIFILVASIPQYLMYGAI